MKGITHLTIGCVAGLVISRTLQTDTFVTAAICGLGSIIVDIDARSSLINRIVFRGSSDTRNIIKLITGGLLFFSSLYTPYTPYFLQVVSKQHNGFLGYLGVLILLSIISTKVSYKISFLGGIRKLECHRTLFHDPSLGIIIFCIIPYFIFKVGTTHTFLPFFVGVFLHYLADSFTAYGLPFYLTGTRLRMPIHYASSNVFVEYIISGVLILILSRFLI